MASLSRLHLAVLAALVQADDLAHAASLRAEIAERLQAPVNRGALARALIQLRDGGLVSEKRGESAPHGGPRRVLYRITQRGRARLADESRALARVTRVRKLSPAVKAFLEKPPAGSKVARAIAYGIDMNRLARALIQSPQERYREAVDAMKAFRRYAR